MRGVCARRIREMLPFRDLPCGFAAVLAPSRHHAMKYCSDTEIRGFHRIQAWSALSPVDVWALMDDNMVEAVATCLHTAGHPLGAALRSLRSRGALPTIAVDR